MKVGSTYNLQTEIDTLSIRQLMALCTDIEHERVPRQVIILDSDVEIIRHRIDGQYRYYFQGQHHKDFEALFGAVSYYTYLRD